ncbi:hypothetical protein Pla52o_23720 [Novipirellula galeiformis]|uniref:Uncharacterized protein n=1 Tax=Novipirellula galeiformis TaxID=2528004 RepID=A0A5C6CK20_9BACT|nr:hypothetical protein [Novipirellula galeiformis]TWU24445.1 hypothetical protein Pla52o_23720 [Novipirellula galeiformis]
MPKMAPHTDGDIEPASGEFPYASLPLGNVFGRRISISYWVMFAAAVIAGMVLIFGTGPANFDLSVASLLAAVTWLVGAGIQAAIYAAYATRRDAVIHFNLIGVSWNQDAMPGKRTLLAAITTLAALVIAGGGLIAIATVTGRSVAAGPESTFFAIPGLGMTAADGMLGLAGWLLWIQAIAQLYPLRMTLGRHLIAALIVVVGPQLSHSVAAGLLHRMLLGTSVLMAIFAIVVLWFDRPLVMPRWPLLMLLAFGLSRSTSVVEARRLIESLSSVPRCEDPSDESPGSLRLTYRIRGWFAIRRARRVMQRERSEAVDAAKLDEILERLHENGPSSLSSEDRMILKRVSETLKKHRNS